MKQHSRHLAGVCLVALAACDTPESDVQSRAEAITSCYGYNSAWNSNEESEVAEELPQISDECDEIPIGLSRVTGSFWVTADEDVIASESTGIVTDARNLDGTNSMRTKYRLCLCDEAYWDTVDERERCADFSDCLIRDIDRIDNPAVWHTLTLEVSGGGANVPAGGLEVTYNGPYERNGGVETVGGQDILYYPGYRTAVSLDWDARADAEEIADPEDEQGPLFPGESDFELPGVIWTHTPHVTGQPNFSLNKRRLTNHYTSGMYGNIPNPPNPDTNTDLPIGPAPLPFPGCPHCPWSFPTPFLMMPSCFGSTPCTHPAEARFHTAVQNAGTFFSGGAPSGLGATAGKWTAVSEPDFMQGETGLRYAAVATNGTTVNALLNQAATGLSRTIPSNSGSAPSARSLFGVTASVQKNRVWVMGGINASNVLQENLYQFNVGTQTWSQVTITGSYKPSRVLAAAYAPGEDRLLVLDQVTAGGSIRLIRLDPNGSAGSELVGTWSRTASTTTFGLAAEPGNRGYLVACGGTSTHAVLRLKRTTTGSSIWANATGSGSLASGLVQSGIHGISMLVNVSGVPRARGYKTEAMSSGGSAGLCF